MATYMVMLQRVNVESCKNTISNNNDRKISPCRRAGVDQWEIGWSI